MEVKSLGSLFYCDPIRNWETAGIPECVLQNKCITKASLSKEITKGDILIS